MRRKLTWVVLLSTVIVVTALYHAKKAQATAATPPPGFVSMTLALGRFDPINVVNRRILSEVIEETQENDRDRGKDRDRDDIWLSLQKTKGVSDMYVQSNTWQPGGSTGWHSHPGHSLIIVTAGTVTDYEGNDPDCKPHVYTKGMGFVDHGGVHHVHLIRNEGDVMASTIAVQLIPAHPDGSSSAADRRIDTPDPGTCPF